MRIIDISNDILSAEVYEGDPVPELISLASLKNGDRYNLNAVNMGLHNGTHMDAPLHFIDGADGIRFLRWIIDAIENPMKFVVEGK